MASELQRQQRVSAREQSVQTITNNNLTWMDIQNPTRNVMQVRQRFKILLVRVNGG
jgi:hypothetical protein